MNVRKIARSFNDVYATCSTPSLRRWPTLQPSFPGLSCLSMNMFLSIMARPNINVHLTLQKTRCSVMMMKCRKIIHNNPVLLRSNYTLYKIGCCEMLKHCSFCFTFNAESKMVFKNTPAFDVLAYNPTMIH